MNKSTLTPAEHAWVSAAMARIKAIITDPPQPHAEDKHLRKAKMQSGGGLVVIDPKK